MNTLELIGVIILALIVLAVVAFGLVPRLYAADDQASDAIFSGLDVSAPVGLLFAVDAEERGNFLSVSRKAYKSRITFF